MAAHGGPSGPSRGRGGRSFIREVREVKLPGLFAAATLAAAPFATPAQAAAPAPPCAAAQLQALDAGAKAHGARTVTTIQIVNNSPSACQLIGYPGLAMVRADGAPAAFALTHTPLDQNYSVKYEGPVRLASLGSASFYLGYPSKDQHGNSCARISMILITVADDSRPLRVPDTIAPCGMLNISPYFPTPK